jgi:CheY-like chemotaxis protein/HPt (histidine-containing phosphotransfer) domain-containing protein
VDRVITKPAKSALLVKALRELSRSRRAAPVADDRESALFPGLRVLLAEDNVVNQKLAVRLLEKLGAQVQITANGADALRALSSAEFDVVLMDCQMPEMDGYEATRRLRESAGRLRTIPVIALTAHALATDRAKCLAAGMNDYLTKPIDPIRLQQALTKVTLQVDRRAPRQVAPAHEGDLFDEAELRRRTGDDPEFSRELIALFASSAADTLSQMTAQIGLAGDPRSLKRLAHTLKGSASAVAAGAIAAGAAALEKADDAGMPSQLRSLNAAFKATVALWESTGWLVPAQRSAGGSG